MKIDLLVFREAMRGADQFVDPSRSPSCARLGASGNEANGLIAVEENDLLLPARVRRR